MSVYQLVKSNTPMSDLELKAASLQLDLSNQRVKGTKTKSESDLTFSVIKQS